MTDIRTARTWAEVDLDALAHNYHVLRGLAPEAKFLGLVKADAYGHGAVPVARKLETLGADMLAVACLAEAIELRQAGIAIPVLCLGQTPPELAPELLAYGVTQTVGDLETGKALSAAAVAAGKELAIHIKLDTGMGRLGFTGPTLEEEVRARGALPGLEAEGIFTHFANADGEWSAGERWFLTAGIAAYQHLVHSIDRTVSAPTEGAADGSERRVAIGYRKGRTELSAFASAKWRPTERLGLSLVVREESYGTEWAAPIPALFADWLLTRRGNLLLKASVSRNYRFPTLNDRYFQPGGNPDLRPESGFTYDAGISFATNPEKSWSLKGSAAWFDARIDDWILWLPTVKGFYSPVNVKRVHAYGIELQATLDAALARAWQLTLDGHASWTPSINEGDPMSEGDRSVGKQLVYVPEYTASLTGSLRFRTWSLLYKWCYYSERYTMTSNDRTLTGYLPPYFMNGVTLEKRFAFRRLDLSLKGSVENLFDEEYLSVLSRPMPGIHFEFFVGITPKWGKKAGK